MAYIAWPTYFFSLRICVCFVFHCWAEDEVNLQEGSILDGSFHSLAPRCDGFGDEDTDFTLLGSCHSNEKCFLYIYRLYVKESFPTVLKSELPKRSLLLCSFFNLGVPGLRKVENCDFVLERSWPVLGCCYSCRFVGEFKWGCHAHGCFPSWLQQWGSSSSTSDCWAKRRLNLYTNQKKNEYIFLRGKFKWVVQIRCIIKGYSWMGDVTASQKLFFFLHSSQLLGFAALCAPCITHTYTHTVLHSLHKAFFKKLLRFSF